MSPNSANNDDKPSQKGANKKKQSYKNKNSKQLQSSGITRKKVSHKKPILKQTNKNNAFAIINTNKNNQSTLNSKLYEPKMYNPKINKKSRFRKGRSNKLSNNNTANIKSKQSIQTKGHPNATVKKNTNTRTAKQIKKINN